MERTTSLFRWFQLTQLLSTLVKKLMLDKRKDWSSYASTRKMLDFKKNTWNNKSITLNMHMNQLECNPLIWSLSISLHFQTSNMSKQIHKTDGHWTKTTSKKFIKIKIWLNINNLMPEIHLCMMVPNKKVLEKLI